MKKLFAFLSSIMMALALVVPVFADGSNTITIDNSTEGYTYEAYQIFSGTYDAESQELTKIEWGSGVSIPEGKLEGKTAEEWANKLSGEPDNSANVQAFAVKVYNYLNQTNKKTSAYDETGSSPVYKISGLDDGYYLVINPENGVPSGKDDDGNQTTSAGVYTKYLLKVVGNVTVEPKGDSPSVEKKVWDVNDTDSSTENWEDSADHDLNDNVAFKITAELPTKYAEFKSYKMVFHDTMSSGLTYDTNSLQIYASDNDLSTKTVGESSGLHLITQDGTNVSTSISGGDGSETSITVTINDLKTATVADGYTISKDTKIIVVYTATLNEKSVIGKNGNPNKVYLKFSNNPNYNGLGANSPTGDTPEDQVIVFTYKLTVDKTDGSNNPLEGATFALYKKYSDSNNTMTIDDETYTGYVKVGESIIGTEQSTFSWERIDDGEYLLVEESAPEDYVAIKPLAFRVTATHDKDAPTPKLLTLSGGDKVSGTVDTGELKTTVANNLSTSLPSTGGMGTTLFYIIGGILVAGAAILFVTNKRMKLEK